MGFSDYYKKRKEEEKKSVSAHQGKSTEKIEGFADYYKKRSSMSSEDFERYQAGKKFGIDTLGADLEGMAATLDSIYGGWQDKDTMEKTKSEVEGMYNRLLSYEDYRTKYGDDKFADLSELTNAYKGALDEWDALSEGYSSYKNADKFNAAVEKSRKKAEEDAKLREEMLSADLDAVQTELTSLEEMLGKAKEYDDNVYQQKVYRNAEGYKTAQTERDEYLSSIGYSSADEIEKAISDKKKFTRDAEVLQNEDKALKSEDFEKYSQIGAGIENPTYDEALTQFGIGPLKIIGGKEIGNKLKFAKDNRDDILGSQNPENAKSPVSRYYLEANESEQRVYEYYLGQEAEGLAEKGTADKYLDSILPRLKAREEEGQLKQLDEFAHGGFWSKAGASALSVMYSLGGAVEHVADSIDYAKTGIMDDNFNARASSTIRSRVSQDVDWEIGNWDAFDFLYNTTMSGIDSASVMWMPGASGAVVLGLSAAGQGVNDALDRGLDSKQAFWNGMFSGAFEMAFEKFSIGNFKAFKDMSVDGLKAGFKNLGKTMLVNASEETLTEIANITYDKLAHGDFSHYAIRMQELIDSGMSKEEATRKVNLEMLDQSLQAGASGAFMGMGFGTVGNIIAAHNTKAIGKSITANENVGKVFDMASVSPEASTAYEAYTQYANKGVTAENAKTRQVGALALDLKNDALKTLNDRNSTEAEKAQAEKVLSDLEAYTKKGEAISDSSIVLEKDENKYPYDQQKVIEGYEGAVDDKVINFIDNVRSLKDDSFKKTRRVSIGKVNDRLQSKIKSLLGIDISEYDNVLTGNALLHIDKDHGKDGLSDSSMSNDEDIARMGFVIQNFDDIEVIQGAFDKVHQNKDQTPSPLIKMSKKINGTYYVVESVPDSSAKSLFVKSAYISKNNSNGSSGQLKMSSDPQLTSETLARSSAVPTISDTVVSSKDDAVTVNSISQKGGVVNSELMEAAKGMDEGDAELFIKTYDGHTDVDYYTDSFNLVKDYAKDNYSVDFILENSHGLTPRQVQQIYNKVVAEPRAEQQKALDELVKKYEGKLVHKANIDDSIFNGENGKKLWRNLNSRQKQAITFVKAFAKGAGINLTFTDEGVKGKYNGYYDKKTNTIVIDVRAGVGTKMYGMKDAIIPTLSHELTHWMKQKSPELYAELSKTIFNVLEKKDGLTEGDRIALERAVYKKNHNGKEMSVDAARDEIIARACEDLFAMSEEGRKIFNSLSETEQKTLRDKIKGIIKNLVDWVNELLGTYESKSYEAAALRDFKEELSEISKLWDQMLVKSIEANKALTAEGTTGEALANEAATDAQMSARETITQADVDAVRNISEAKGEISINEFSSDDIVASTSWAKKFYSEIGFKSPFFRAWFGDWRANEKTNVSVIYAGKTEGKNPRGVFKNKDTGWNINSSSVGYDETTSHSGKDKLSLIAMRSVDEIIKNSVLLDTEVSSYGRGKKSIYTAFMHKFYSPVVIDGKPYIAKLAVDESYAPGQNDTNKKFYHVRAIKIEPVSSVGIGFNHTPIMDGTSSDISISDLFQLVKTYDKEFTPKEASKIVNADGTPKVMYHGSREQFTVFDKRKAKSSGAYGKGFYFTDSDSHAKQYGNTYAVYLDVKNPLKQGESNVTEGQIRKFLETVAENEDYSIENYGTYDVKEILGKIESKDAFSVIQDINATAIGDMVEAVKLWNDVNGTSFDGIIVPTETVVFEPTQIKSATDNIGTFDKENEDIQFSEKDYPIDTAIQNKVNDAITKSTNGMHKISEITQAQNNAINRLVNSTRSDAYRGRYTGGKHLLSDNAIRHVISEHGDFLREALRAQLPMTPNDIARHLSAVKADKYPSDVKPSKTKEGYPSIITIYEVNGYTLYAEEITKPLGKNTPSDLMGHTMYKAPTLPTAAFYTTSVQTQPKRQSMVLHNYYTTDSADLSRGNFITDTNGQPALLSYSVENGSAKQDARSAGLIALSSDKSNFTDKNKSYGQGYVVCKKPYYITADNRVFSNSETNVAEKINELKKQGYDCFIFDKVIGDNYMVAVVNKAQIISDNVNFVADEDIQKSERDTGTSAYDLVGEHKTLERRYKKLESDFENLKERLKLEKTLTKGKIIQKSQLEAVARYLIKYGDSNYSSVELAKLLNNLYVDIQDGATDGTMTFDEMYAKCYEVAEKIRTEAKVKVERPALYEKILKDIRSARIAPNEGQKGDAKHRFGDHYIGKFRGRVIIANDGVPLDTKWSEWASLYPSVFDKNISPSQQLVELYDIYEDLRNAGDVVQEYEESEMLHSLATEIVNKAWTVTKYESTADKYDRRIKELKAEHRKAMEELRDTYHKKESDAKLLNQVQTKRKQAKRLGREKLAQYRENAERKSVIQAIENVSLALNKKLTTNSKDVHIPESLKPVVVNLLNAIDFSSQRMLNQEEPTKRDFAIDKSLSKVHSMDSGTAPTVSLKQSIEDALKLFQNAEKVSNGTSDGNADISIVALDTDAIADIEKMITHLNMLTENGKPSFVLQEMSTEDLKTLNKMVRSIRHWASVADQALANKHKKRVSDLSIQTIDETKMLGDRQEYVGKIENVKDFFNWSNLLPVNAFHRLGISATEFFDGLRDSQDKLTFNRQLVMDFMDNLIGKYKKQKINIKDWRTDVKTFDVQLPGEENTTKVKMPVSFIMTLYCVAKQEDAKRHLYGKDASGNKLTYTDEDGKVYDGGGMTIKGYKEGKFKLKVNKNLDNTIINESIVKQITSVLTKEQIEVADAMQEFMDTTGSEWGNAVSMALYGIKKFGIKNYFPLSVSPHTLPADMVRNDKASLFSILNYGLTKERNPLANQSIEIGDIFDVFANHMNMIAIYNAYALSIYDIARWYNFKGKAENGKEIAVTKSIEKAFGKGATTYVSNLIKDLNGQHASSRLGFIGQILKNEKVAMVGNSLSVALLQPTAYFKAMTKISPKYLLKAAMYIRDFGAKKGVEKAQKYCGIALLKSQGYFETGVSANTTTKMLHDESLHEKAIEWSLKGAEIMDEKTWGVLWNACEFEVRATRKDLKVGSEEFYEAIGEKLRDVIYETQVVDSPLTKSDLMRSPDTGAKMITMFASEMTVAYNMVYESVYNTLLDTKKYGKNEALKKNRKNILMNLASYTLTGVATGILQTAVQNLRKGFRDDDEDKEFEDLVKEAMQNVFSEWLIIGKIPYFKEIVNIAEGYSPSLPGFSWLISAFKAYEAFVKASEGKEGQILKATEEIMKTFSYGMGIAIYNQWRELKGTLKTIGIME